MQNLCYFLEKISFLKIYALCREIHFVAIYTLLCGKKFIQKFSSWRKNDKYDVCEWVWYLSNSKSFTRSQDYIMAALSQHPLTSLPTELLELVCSFLNARWAYQPSKLHSKKKQDPGSFVFLGKIRKNRKNSEIYFLGKFFRNIRKKLEKYFEKFGKIVEKIWKFGKIEKNRKNTFKVSFFRKYEKNSEKYEKNSEN